MFALSHGSPSVFIDDKRGASMNGSSPKYSSYDTGLQGIRCEVKCMTRASFLFSRF